MFFIDYRPRADENVHFCLFSFHNLPQNFTFLYFFSLLTLYNHPYELLIRIFSGINLAMNQQKFVYKSRPYVPSECINFLLVNRKLKFFTRPILTTSEDTYKKKK